MLMLGKNTGTYLKKLIILYANVKSMRTSCEVVEVVEVLSGELKDVSVIANLFIRFYSYLSINVLYMQNLLYYLGI